MNSKLNGILLELNIAYKQAHYFGPPKPGIYNLAPLKRGKLTFEIESGSKVEKNTPAGAGYRMW